MERYLEPIEVARARADAERVSGFLDEYPGATPAEIAEALEMEAGDIHGALSRLEGKGRAHQQEGKGEEEPRGPGGAGVREMWGSPWPDCQHTASNSSLVEVEI